MKTVEQAMKKLSRIKVGRLYNDDKPDKSWKSEFDFVWWMVLTELDVYRENFCYGDDDVDHLDKNSAKTAYKWLKETQHLTIEFKDSSID